MGLLNTLFPAPPLAAAAMAPSIDDVGDARAAIAEATQAIRRHREALEQAKAALESARALEERTREQLELTGHAEGRLAAAREADASERKRRALAGAPGTDPALVKAIAKAQRELEEAEAAEEAARAALPTLAARTREAAQAIRDIELERDAAVWNLRMAQIALELPDVRSAYAVLAEFARKLAVLSDVGLYGKSYGAMRGSVPPDFLELCAAPSFSRDELSFDIHAEVDYLKRLRVDPEAQSDA
jgi:hypothetical protein